MLAWYYTTLITSTRAGHLHFVGQERGGRGGGRGRRGMGKVWDEARLSFILPRVSMILLERSFSSRNLVFTLSKNYKNFYKYSIQHRSNCHKGKNTFAGSSRSSVIYSRWVEPWWNPVFYSLKWPLKRMSWTKTSSAELNTVFFKVEIKCLLSQAGKTTKPDPPQWEKKNVSEEESVFLSNCRLNPRERAPGSYCNTLLF